MQTIFLRAFALFSLAAGSSAQVVITSWDFTGASGDQVSTPASLTASNVTGIDFTRGSGITATAASNSISASGWDDLSPDDYFTFGFQVAGGFSVQLDDLQISTRSSNTGPANLVLRFSVDNFTTDLATIVNSGTAFTNIIVDLSTLPALTGNVEFRLYAANNTSAAGGTIGSQGTLRVARYQDPVTNTFLPVELRGTVGSGGIGTSFCPQAVANSTGSPGQLQATGSAIRAQNDVTLVASQLPNNSFGFFLTSRDQGLINQPGGSEGVLCLAGSIGRYVGPGQIKNSGATGSFSLAINLNTMPTPQGSVSALAGETWRFQTWYRDVVGGNATSNFTTAYSVTFQ